MNVRTLCLGSLCLQDSTGYQIKKLFESAFSHFHTASYGSIYPSLNQLLEDDLVECTVETGERHPDRKLFSVTEKGRQVFLEELATTPPREQLRSEFMVLLFFSHLLSCERLIEILDEIEATYQQQLDYLESLDGCGQETPGMRFTVEFGIASYQAALNFVRENRASLLKSHRQVCDMKP